MVEDIGRERGRIMADRYVWSFGFAIVILAMGVNGFARGSLWWWPAIASAIGLTIMFFASKGLFHSRRWKEDEFHFTAALCFFLATMLSTRASVATMNVSLLCSGIGFAAEMVGVGVTYRRYREVKRKQP